MAEPPGESWLRFDAFWHCDMGILRKLKIAAENPTLAGYYVWSRIDADRLINSYQQRAAKAGLDRLYFILSFDCDRPEDIDAAMDVHWRLMDLGICPAYAVPGELLKIGAKAYQRIAATGAEFLNHGHRWHMYFDPEAGDYRSCFFYDELPQNVVEEDVLLGDQCVKDVIGRRPTGFRTPHFGTFQRETELRFLHRILARLGYLFSTSTTPGFGLRYGPAFRRYGLLEIPVSGRGYSPFEILDSWSCFAAPGRKLTPQDYRRDAVRMAERLQGRAGLLNYYCDPSHIVDQPVFFETIQKLVKLAEPLSYGKFVERFA
jgi:hypothetical protein